MKIRRALPEDSIEIAKVHVESWQAAYVGIIPDDKLTGIDYTRRAEGFRKGMLGGEEDFFVIEEGNEIIGMLVLGPCRDPDVDQETTREIMALYLGPEHWRRGIGRSLYLRCENFLRSRGCRKVVLWVFENNDRARRFYEAMGFRFDGNRKAMDIGVPLDAVRYSKELYKYQPIIEPAPKEADLALIRRGIDENNVAVTGQSTGNEKLTLFIRNEKREIIGGVQGTYNNSGWLHIYGIWVAAEYRGNGYGMQLMKCIESEAKKHGCTKCHLNTIEHQAPDFYKKLGYEVFATLEKYHQNYAKLFLRKEIK